MTVKQTKKKAAPALAPTQMKKIDDMIDDNAKKPDIVNALVGGMGADSRQVEEYLKQNKTLQGKLNTITRRAKDTIGASSEKERREIADEIAKIGKGAIKSLQKKAGQ